MLPIYWRPQGGRRYPQIGTYSQPASAIAGLSVGTTAAVVATPKNINLVGEPNALQLTGKPNTFQLLGEPNAFQLTGSK